MDDVAFFQIRHDRPIGQGSDAAFAGNQLNNGNGQLAVAARRINAFGQQYFFGQIQHLIGDGISNQGFVDKVFCFPNVFVGKRVVFCADADHFIGKQGAVADAVERLGFGNDGKVGAVLQQQSDRIGLETGNDVQFNLRP